MSTYDSLEASYRRNVEFFEANYDELLEKYPDQWIAILDQKVLGSADDPSDLVRRLRARGVETQHVLFEEMETDPPLLLLTSL